MTRLLFLELLNRSIAAGWLIAAVLLFRVLLRRFPRWSFCLMWGIVGVRLLLPFCMESGLSLIPSVRTVEPAFDLGRMVVQTGIAGIDAPVNAYLDMRFDAAAVAPKVWYDQALQLSSTVWLCGAGLLLLYGIAAEVRLRRRVRASLCCGSNVYICDDIASPFVLGVVRPRIYLPSEMDITQTKSVLLHERAHIARRDPLWKVLGFLLLCVYWFDPFVWVAYAVFCRDIELACDERVIREIGDTEKREYAQTLLYCSLRPKTAAVCPVAFGEVGVKRRIRSIVWFKKAGERKVMAAVVLCAVLAVGFLTNPSVHAEEIGENSRSYGPDSTVVLLPCSCADREIVFGEYFYPQSGALFSECAFCDYPRMHVHESGAVLEIGRCVSCDQMMYLKVLYEGDRCLSRDGAFVRSECFS